MASWLLQVFNTHVRRIAGRGYSYFHLYIFVFIYLCVALPLSKMKNDTDLKFGTHSPKLHLITVFFFFSKIGPRGSPPHLEKLPCHKDFPHISSIALFYFQNPRDASRRSRIFLFSLMNIVCTAPPGRTKNYTDLKFGTNTTLDYI